MRKKERKLGGLANKRNYALKVKNDLRNGTKFLSVFFLIALVLVGIVRVGWISIIKQDTYKGQAENTSYTEKIQTAQRGTIYTSDMSVVATSYSVWDFGVDPSALHTRLDNDIAPTKLSIAGGGSDRLTTEEKKASIIETEKKYLESVAKFLAYVLNDGVKKSSKKYLTTDDILSALNSGTSYVKKDGTEGFTYSSYIKIKNKITASQKMQIEYVLGDCYYNYYFDEFMDLSYNPDKDGKAGKDVTPTAEKNGDNVYYYFYNYKTDTYSEKSSSAKDSRFSSQIGCKCVEVSSFIFDEQSVRSYAENGFCSAFLGFKSGNGATGGIESYYNSTLAGKDGKISGLAVNDSGVMVASSESSQNEAQDGNNLVLTVNPDIQSILEDNLKSTYETYSADETFGIVMDVNTGAIYAMSDYPNYDLNNPSKITDEKNALEKAKTQIVLENEATNKLDDDGEPIQPTDKEVEERARNNQWSCFCVNYPYELGSTFKLFTASAGLEEGVITTNNYFYTCSGAYEIQDRTISCSHGTKHGSLSMSEGLAKSCNAFFIHLGLTLGKNAFNKYFKSFGLSEKTGIDVSGEEVGSNKATDSMTKMELASTAFGQTATITAIQLITGVSAIANGGDLVTPYLVDRIIDNDGNVVSKTETTVKRKVISSETCEKVRDMMKGVVYEKYGTAYGYLKVDGYTVAGKTGSGEIQGQGSSTGTNGYKYTASFVGFAPAEDPQVAILIGIRNPEGGYLSGGQIAAPVAGTVLSYALSALEIQSPTGGTDKTVVPDFEENPVLTAKTKISDLGCTYAIFGEGKTVVSQLPEAGTKIPESGVIVLFTDKGSYEVEVPDFAGLTKSDALSVARRAGVNIVCNGNSNSNDVIVKQSRDAGKKVKPGYTIEVTFGNE